MAVDQSHGTATNSADFNEHVRTWKGFVTFIKYSVVSIVILMALLAMFRTHG